MKMYFFFVFYFSNTIFSLKKYDQINHFLNTIENNLFNDNEEDGAQDAKSWDFPLGEKNYDKIIQENSEFKFPSNRKKILNEDVKEIPILNERNKNQEFRNSQDNIPKENVLSNFLNQVEEKILHGIEDKKSSQTIQETKKNKFFFSDDISKKVKSSKNLRFQRLPSDQPTEAPQTQELSAESKPETTNDGTTLNISDNKITDNMDKTKAIDSNKPVEQKVKKGPQGPRGDLGPRGATGKRGPKGEKGELGEPAKINPLIKGPLGQRGPIGDEGEPGDDGVIGDKGENGNEGLQGEKGKPGRAGNSGRNGDKGQKGPKGPKGIRGPQGPKGRDGELGQRGLKGDQGVKGMTGIQGEIGPQGRKGPRGGAAMLPPKEYLQNVTKNIIVSELEAMALQKFMNDSEIVGMDKELLKKFDPQFSDDSDIDMTKINTQITLNPSFAYEIKVHRNLDELDDEKDLQELEKSFNRNRTALTILKHSQIKGSAEKSLIDSLFSNEILSKSISAVLYNCDIDKKSCEMNCKDLLSDLNKCILKEKFFVSQNQELEVEFFQKIKRKMEVCEIHNLNLK